MLYLAIPAQNEDATIGVLLWRLRTVLAEFPREYEVVVYDDASSDETAAVAEQYTHAMPVTVLRGATPVGYAGAVDALVRYVAGHTRYPRRDAMLILQADFTDPPGIVPEFARRFEGGADLVVGERTTVVDAPVPVRRLFTAAAWALKPFVRVEGLRDLTGSMRLVRISALRDLLRTVGDAPVCEGDSWTANADLLLQLVPHARRVETVPVEPTYGVRTRDTRRVTVRDALAALRWGWRARGRRVKPSTTPEVVAEVSTRNARLTPGARRRDEPEVTVDRLRERSKERDKLRGERPESEQPRSRRDGRTDGRGEGRGAAQRDESAVAARPPLPEEPKVARTEEKREERSKKTAGSQRGGSKRGGRPTAAIDPRVILDDPFAAPTARVPSSASLHRPDRITTPDDDERDEKLPDLVDQQPTVTTPDAGRRAESSAGEDSDTEVIADAGVGESELVEDAENAADSVDSSERKRRRNRRSRRRRSKTRGDGVESSASDDSSGRANEPPSSGARAHSEDADERDDDAPDERGEPVNDSGAGGDGPDDGSDEARASRARRRGRRGRRGGSRRSRGRNREGDDGSSGADGTSSDAGDRSEPPTAD